MTSLINQINELQKQQNILTEQIKQEEERQAKLNMDSSITRLEALIEPITQELDWVRPPLHNGVYYGYACHQSARERLNYTYQKERENRILKNQKVHPRQQAAIPSKLSGKWNMVGCEEIFITLLGIIKKQEERINKLESQYLRNN